MNIPFTETRKQFLYYFRTFRRDTASGVVFVGEISDRIFLPCFLTTGLADVGRSGLAGDIPSATRTIANRNSPLA